MFRKLGIYLGFALIAFTAQAEPGDTIRVQAHDAMDIIWWGAYDQDVEFELGDTEIEKAQMTFTMGCSSANCSDWDYTVRVEVGVNTGLLDSTAIGFDTTSVAPLVIDTFWNYTPNYEFFQIGKLITPYGTYMNINNNAYGVAGFDDSWTHDFEFDVSDYVHLLRDEAKIRVFYEGWQNGYSATINFDFIEGTPPRVPQKVSTIYRPFTYSTEAEVEAGPLSARKVFIQPDTESARIAVWYSGHGADNQNCAEFCERNYSLEVGGDLIANQSLWRDDCGEVALYPQGGTWVYNRGNWCPGDKIERYEHDVTFYAIPGDSMDVNIDLFPHYNSSGDANFSFNVQLIEYGPSSYDKDVAIVDIISPSDKDNYSRKNPICGEPVIRIKNNGTDVMNSCAMRYGIVGGIDVYYEWSGNLKYQEEEEVTLPTGNWFNVEDNPVFFCQVGLPNGHQDQYEQNNRMTSNVATVEDHDDPIVFAFRTNNRPAENSWELSTHDGTIIMDGSGFSANQTYEETFDLPDGCYTLVFRDFDPNIGGGDGLSWWANSDESDGWLQIENEDGDVLKSFLADFGSEVRYNFTMGYAMGEEPTPIITDPIMVNIESEYLDSQVDLFPNPNSGAFLINFEEQFDEAVQVNFYSSDGQIIHSLEIGAGSQSGMAVELPDTRSGLVIAKFSTASGHSTWKKMIIK